MKGFANKAGDVIRTKKGKELHIETSKKRELCLEKIEAEDAVELIYIGKVKKDIPSGKNIDWYVFTRPNIKSILYRKKFLYFIITNQEDIKSNSAE